MASAKPQRVLYIDGEMPMSLLKERYAMVVGAAMTEASGQNFRMLAADFQQDGLPDLADPDTQKLYDGVATEADLIILDNYSTLARGLKENEADSFGPVQGWLLAQRAAGRSVLAVHHAGKSGGQRGPRRRGYARQHYLAEPPAGIFCVRGRAFRGSVHEEPRLLGGRCRAVRGPLRQRPMNHKARSSRTI